MSQKLYPESLTFFDDPSRDSRRRVLSLAYIVLCASELLPDADGERTVLAPIRGSKAWGSLRNEHVELAFDHSAILSTALDYARLKASRDPLWALDMMSSDRQFTVAGLVKTLAALDITFTQDALRRKIVGDSRVSKRGWVDQGSGRPANLYKAAAM